MRVESELKDGDAVMLVCGDSGIGDDDDGDYGGYSDDDDGDDEGIDAMYESMHRCVLGMCMFVCVQKVQRRQEKS